MVSMSSVKRTISMSGENKLSRLCAAAWRGGLSGYAYYVKAINYSSGNIIPDATPFHNIYARNSPAEWVHFNNQKIEVKNRLDRDSNNNYHFTLGGFRNYSHYSSSNSNVNDEIKVPIGGSNHRFKLSFSTSLGSVDWRIYSDTGTNRASKIGLVIYNSSDLTVEAGSSPLVTLNGLSNVDFIDTEFRMSTANPGVFNLPTKLMLYDSYGNRLGTLPGKGNIKITVLGKPKEGELRILTKVNGLNLAEVYLVKTGSTTVNLSANTILAEFTYQWLYDSNPPITRYLKSALYESVDRDTEETRFSSTVNNLQGASGFFPKSLYKSPSSSLVYAPTTYLTPGNNLYLRVTLYYE